MNLLRLLAVLAIAISGFPVRAQNLITELSGSTYRETALYAVYDLAGKDLNGGSPGSMPMAIAESGGRQDIVALLKNNGAR